jgi:hypothetical protein
MKKDETLHIRISAELAQMIDDTALLLAKASKLPADKISKAGVARVALEQGLKSLDKMSRIISDAGKGAKLTLSGDLLEVSDLFDQTKADSIRKDLKKGKDTQTAIAQRHGVTRQHVSQEAKRLRERGEL